MDSSFFLSSSQLSFESFGDEALLSSCSSMSSAGDLPDHLDLPDYFDLPDAQLNDTEEPEERFQCVGEEMLVCAKPEGANILTALNYGNAFEPSGLATVLYPSSICQAGPLHMSVRSMLQGSHELCYGNVKLSSARRNIPVTTFEKPNLRSGRGNVMYVNNTHTPRQGSATIWQGERSQVAKGPENLYTDLEYDNLTPPVVVDPNFEEATAAFRRPSRKHSSRRDVPATTTKKNSASIRDNQIEQNPLTLPKPPGTLIENQLCGNVQQWTVPELHENVRMMNTTTTNSVRSLGGIDKSTNSVRSLGGIDKSTWVLPWQLDNKRLLCCDLAEQRPKPVSFRESKVTTPAQDDSLRHLQPGEMQADLLPAKLRHFATPEGSFTTEASRCCTKEKKIGFKSQIQTSCPAPRAPDAQTHPTSSAHLVEEDASTETRLEAKSICETRAVIKTPLEHDILLGRGHRLNKHPGNVRFRSFVQQHQDEYLSTPVFEMKTSMTHMLVELCKEPFTYKCNLVKPRFLRFHRELNGWEEVSDEVARRKVSHLLRKKMSPPKIRKFVAANFP